MTVDFKKIMAFLGDISKLTVLVCFLVMIVEGIFGIKLFGGRVIYKIAGVLKMMGMQAALIVLIAYKVLIGK